MFKRKKVTSVRPENDAAENVIETGRCAERTDETPEADERDFGRKRGGTFFFIDGNGIIGSRSDSGTASDFYYDSANYCHNEELLRNRSLREKLSRLLWRYSYERGMTDDILLSNTKLYNIFGHYGSFSVDGTDEHFFSPAFITAEIARDAIADVCIPFAHDNPTLFGFGEHDEVEADIVKIGED